MYNFETFYCYNNTVIKKRLQKKKKEEVFIMAHEFESGFMVREPAWHGLGTIVENAPTSAEALQLAGLDWRVKSEPIFVGGKEVPNYKANVRESDGTTLGIVKDRYSIIQNSEAFDFTDQLLGQGVTYETAGSLRGGKTIWLLARMDSTKILGDEILPYLCFTNTHDGSAPVRVCMTNTRVVCNNTLSLALRSAPRVWSARHMGDIKGKTLDAMETLRLANEYTVELGKFAEEMVKEKLSDRETKEIIDKMFPLPKDATERQKASVDATKADFMVCMLAPDLQNFLNTKWQIIQATADYVSHREPKRQTSNYKENVWGSLINGNYLLDRVMEAVA